MSDKVLMTVRGEPVFITPSGEVYFDAGASIDADGSPHAYAPKGSGLRGLDDLANAGSPGNWYGLACGWNGQPIVQGNSDPAPGFYVSPTAYRRKHHSPVSPMAYLDSETVPFIVVPGPLRKLVRPVVLGCRAIVSYNGKQVECVVGDIGPATHLGEMSIACAKAVGINPDARRGGVAGGVRYTIFPGETALGLDLCPV